MPLRMLWDVGVSEELLTRMAATNPATLLGLQ